MESLPVICRHINLSTSEFQRVTAPIVEKVLSSFLKVEGKVFEFFFVSTPGRFYCTLSICSKEPYRFFSFCLGKALKNVWTQIILRKVELLFLKIPVHQLLTRQSCKINGWLHFISHDTFNTISLIYAEKLRTRSWMGHWLVRTWWVQVKVNFTVRRVQQRHGGRRERH